MVDVKTGLEQTTNDFRFTWFQEHGSSSPNLRHVVPKTYKGVFLGRDYLGCAANFSTEAMLWLEGKRALEVGAEIREQHLKK